MAMPTLLVTHGRDQRWKIELTLAREWEEALRSGLKRVGAPYWDAVPVRFAYYGGAWRDDLEERSDDITPIQAEFATELLERAGKPGDAAADDRSIWSGLNRLVQFVDEHAGVGGEVVLEHFLQDLAQYFSDRARRKEANGVLAAEAREAKGDVILLGHSMGTIVSYVALHEERAALKRVRGLLTFGSPLGMRAMRKHTEAIVPGLPFPDAPRRWVNVFNDEDFATTVPELAGIFKSRDGRKVEDAPAQGKAPSIGDPGRGHDPLIYLSSRGLAEHLRSLIDDAGGGTATARVSTRPGATERGRGGAGGGGGGRGPAAEPPEPASTSARRTTRAAPSDAFGRERVAPPWLGDEAEEDEAEEAAPTTRGVDLDRAFGAERSADAPKPAMRNGGDRGPTGNGGGITTARRPRTGQVKKAARHVEKPSRTAAAPTVVNRTLSADFPPVVAPDSERDLLIAIASQAVYGGAEAVLRIERPRGVQRVNLRIGVYAPDFAVTNADGEATSVAALTLDLDRPDQRLDARFRLRAPKVRQPRDASIWVSVWRGTLPIGQMELRTRIDPAYVTPAGSIKLSFTEAKDPDVTLVVADRSDGVVGEGPFDLRVSREGEFIDLDLGRLRVTNDAWQAARDILEKYRAVNKLGTKKERIARATSIGVDLWRLLPEGFRDFYWDELHDSDIRSIAIYSQEPYIPWELIVPQRRPGGPTEPMLGVAFSIARWKQGRHFPDPLAVSGISVIAPEYSVGALPEAAKEAEDLIVTFGAKRVTGNWSGVTRLLRSRGTQLIHFAGHGSYDPTNVDDSEIRLSDGTLVPGDLFNASIGTKERPFVFLNACQVGEAGWDLTQIGGWAEAFCAAGFSGFVGPYWKVNDLVARKAARVFYAALDGKQTVGEAMQAVRRRFLEDDEYPAHTSWLAYSLHCQPNVHIQLPSRDA